MPEDRSDELAAEERRSFDRLVNFTDAVVAIGITLQLLPLIDVAGPQPGQTVWQILDENSGQLTAFVLSFIVVIANWSTHNRVFNVMHRYDGRVFALNVLWLILIVFLPWPTAMYGEAANDQVVSAGGVGLLYWVTLAAISATGSAIAFYAYRHPALLVPGALDRGREKRKVGREIGVVFPIVFLAIGIVSEFAPGLAPFLALALWPISTIIHKRHAA